MIEREAMGEDRLSSASPSGSPPRDLRHALRALGFFVSAFLVVLVGRDGLTIPEYSESDITVLRTQTDRGRKRSLQVEIVSADGRHFALSGRLLRGIATAEELTAALRSERTATVTHWPATESDELIQVTGIRVGQIWLDPARGLRSDRGTRRIILGAFLVLLGLSAVYFTAWWYPSVGELLDRASSPQT